MELVLYGIIEEYLTFRIILGAFLFFVRSKKRWFLRICMYLRDMLRYGELSKKQKIQLFLHHSYSARCCINISIELGICTENFVVPRNNELITIMEWMRSTN